MRYFISLDFLDNLYVLKYINIKILEIYKHYDNQPNQVVLSSGLAEQLLSIVVAQERPDLEELRGQLIVSRAQLSTQLAEMQSDILYGLSNSEGSPVDDLPLILTLEAIKIKSAEILVRLKMFSFLI